MNSRLWASTDINQIDSNTIERALIQRYTFPDSAISSLEILYGKYMHEADTLNAIFVLKNQANVYGHQAAYRNSYDKLWKALLLADKANLFYAKALILIDIGRYFSFYKRKEKAIEYFQLALDINKDLENSGQISKALLVQNYYAMCATYRELGNPKMARIYLDSCFLFHEPEVSSVQQAYLQFEKAFLLYEDRRFEQAIQIYESILPWIRENDRPYQVLLYTYTGDAYRMISKFKESEQCYNNALSISKKYNSHIDFTPLIHEKLSELFFSKGDLAAAFDQLQTAKKLNEDFFDSRSENNRPLLEIQDAFRKNQQEQIQQRQEQRLAQLESEEKVLFLQKIILISSLVFLAIVGFLYAHFIRSKHAADKEFIRKKQELEMQKANEIVELKNKELAAYALKLIEKDEMLATLRNKLTLNKGDIDRKEVRQLMSSISTNSAQNWEEFEARFVSVNHNFYRILNRQFPKLTQGDQKLCALIKLNFSSKDIAKLLGISVESVHTTRYRLRKKLALRREHNLTTFINNL